MSIINENKQVKKGENLSVQFDLLQMGIREKVDVTLEYVPTQSSSEETHFPLQESTSLVVAPILPMKITAKMMPRMRTANALKSRSAFLVAIGITLSSSWLLIASLRNIFFMFYSNSLLCKPTLSPNRNRLHFDSFLENRYSTLRPSGS